MDNRATKTIELPSGGKVEIVEKWTFDEYLKIESHEVRIAKSIDIAEKTATIDYDATRSTTLEAMLLAVKKFTAADGTDLPLTLATFAEMEVEDGLVLRDAVNSIATNSKKA